MLITFYFPLFDTRDFFPDRGRKNSKPAWPNLRRDQFVFQRNLGQIVSRRLGGIRGWVAESDICEVRSSLRVTGPKPAFQRFFSDGWAGGYFSLGFDQSSARQPGSSLSLADLIERLFERELRSRHVHGSLAVRNAGELVAELYNRGTTGKAAPVLAGQVIHGPPIVIVEGDDAFISALFGRGRRIGPPDEAAHPAQFAYSRLRSKGVGPGTPVFGLAGSSKALARKSTRLSRMVLARLYCELFVFERALTLLGEDCDAMDEAGVDSLLARIDLAANRLQGSRRPKLVNAPEDYSSLVDLFASEHDPGRIDELTPMLERLKLSPNLRGAIMRAARPLIVEKKSIVTTYNNYGNAGAFGQNASATNFTQQTLNASEVHDFLAGMADQARSEGATEEQLAVIEEAKQAAAAGDVEKAKSALQKLGDWGGKFATTVGATVAGAVIKAQLGL